LVVFLGLFIAFPAFAITDNNSSLLRGKILYNANSLGDIWYVYPGDFHRYYIGTPQDTYNVLRNLSLGVSNANFDVISTKVPDRFKGLFIIKPEDAAKIYYVNPTDNTLVYVQNPAAAFYLLQSLSVNISTNDLKSIPIATLTVDKNGLEVSRSWQYLGFWGGINASPVPVRTAPNSQAKILGYFSTINRVKVLAIKKADNSVWYQVDGGRYPGAYVEAKFVSPIPQPAPDQKAVMPKNVKPGDYWINLNIGQEVLTLFKGADPVLATYVSTGMKGSATIQGVFNIQYKYTATRMHGGPPFATHYYDLPNVPWTMYYHGSFGVHGAYWHDEFGITKSAGCTNMTIGDSKYIFNLVSPNIGMATSGAATVANPGTVVYNHY
jgi:Uncharacterized protein conserved in bacteria